MANRVLLHHTKLNMFESWLNEVGCEPLPVQGRYETLRWKGPPGYPMPIIFSRLKAEGGCFEHFTLNDTAEMYVRVFLKCPSPFESERHIPICRNGKLVGFKSPK